MFFPNHLIEKYRYLATRSQFAETPPELSTAETHAFLHVQTPPANIDFMKYC